MRFEDALPDLNRIAEMPSLKLLIKGNHDYWWQSKSKMERALHASIKVLQASSIIVNRVAVVGTLSDYGPQDYGRCPIMCQVMSYLGSTMSEDDSNRPHTGRAAASDPPAAA